MAGTTIDRSMPGQEGLKADAVGFVNGVVLGVASTAPPPVVIAFVFTVMGIVLMFAQRIYRPAFFRHRLEAADADALDLKPPTELMAGPGIIG